MSARRTSYRISLGSADGTTTESAPASRACSQSSMSAITMIEVAASTRVRSSRIADAPVVGPTTTTSGSMRSTCSRASSRRAASYTSSPLARRYSAHSDRELWLSRSNVVPRMAQSVPCFASVVWRAARSVSHNNSGHLDTMNRSQNTVQRSQRDWSTVAQVLGLK